MTSILSYQSALPVGVTDQLCVEVGRGLKHYWHHQEYNGPRIGHFYVSASLPDGEVKETRESLYAALERRGIELDRVSPPTTLSAPILGENMTLILAFRGQLDWKLSNLLCAEAGHHDGGAGSFKIL